MHNFVDFQFDGINPVGMFSKEVDTLGDLNQECSPRIVLVVDDSLV